MKKKAYFLLLIIFFMIFFTHVTPLFANKYSLSLYPPLIRIHVINNNPITSSLNIQNLSDSLVDLRIIVKRFIPATDNFEDIISPQANDNNPTYNELINGFTFTDGNKIVKDLYLAPKQEKKINFKIDLNKIIKNGEYYLSIVFLTNNTEYPELNSSVIKLGIATNVILDYKTNEKIIALIQNFTTQNFFEQGPVSFAISLKNISQHYIMPNAKLNIYDWNGHYIDSITLRSIIIPSSTARVLTNSIDVNNSKVIWGRKNLLGIYTARLEINLTPSGPNLVKNIHFIVFPVRLLLILICIFLLLLTILVKTIIKVKKQNH